MYKGASESDFMFEFVIDVSFVYKQLLFLSLEKIKSKDDESLSSLN